MPPKLSQTAAATTPPGRNHLKGRADDRINAVLAAVGYNFSLLLRWLAALLWALVLLLVSSGPSPQRA
jgi:transposase, IS5 family